MLGALAQHVDHYCERLDTGFWAEPLNALSNISFILAALAVYILARQHNVSRDPSVLWLNIWLVVIGAGSFLFHTFATIWAEMADVLPILVFQLSFLVLYARNVAQLKPARVLMLVVGFFALSHAATSIPVPFLNGSNAYFSAIAFLFGFAVYHRLTNKTSPDALLIAVGIFIVSLGLRTIDDAACAYFPMGTHVFWHLLNGGVLYWVAHAYVVNRAPRPLVIS